MLGIFFFKDKRQEEKLLPLKGRLIQLKDLVELCIKYGSLCTTDSFVIISIRKCRCNFLYFYLINYMTKIWLRLTGENLNTVYPCKKVMGIIEKLLQIYKRFTES